MAKKLVNHYRINLANNAVEIENNILPEALLLITDTDTNTILYNFASPGSGYVSRTFSEDTEYTSFILEKDLAADGVTATTRLQIFIEENETKIEVADSLLDPVHKIRVSTPQNLIDTDFEYGLQGTKWETLELSNNVPSYYVSDSDLPLYAVDSVTTIAGSDVITVRSRDPHGLVVGTPIDIRGLTSRTAEGKYLIGSVSEDTVFTYKASSVQSATEVVSNIYTTITPGQFYSGSQIPFDKSRGIETNERDPSSLTVTTAEPHGYITGSNFYLVNSVGTKQVRISETVGTAPDGRPYVDFENTLIESFQNTNALTETKQVKSTYSRKFDASSVDVTNSRIVWPNHNLRNNDCLLYVPPSGNTQIGGLERFQVYYITSVTTNDFRLTATYNGAAITFSSAGTYTYGKATLNLCYEMAYMQKPSNDYLTYYYSSAWNYGQNGNSGWDFYDFQYSNTGRGNFGIGNKIPSKKLVFTRFGTGINTTIVSNWYGTSQSSQMVMPETTNTPTTYNFIEDIQRYSNNYYAFRTDQSYGYVSGGIYSYYDNQFIYSQGANQFFSRGSAFLILLEDDKEGDSFYAENHGLVDGAEIEIENPTPAPPGGPVYSTDIFGDLISLAQNLSSTGASVNSFGSIANTINAKAADFNVFAIAQSGNLAEQLVGISSSTGVHPGNQAGFVYNSGNGNYLGTGGSLRNFSGGTSRGYSVADGKKWMAAAMYNNGTFQGLMVWVLTGDRIDLNNNITAGAFNISTAANIFYPSAGTYNFHRIYSFVITPAGTIQNADTTGNQGWRFSNGQNAQVTGYTNTSQFSQDDGVWGFAQSGQKVDGNAPGPDYRNLGASYGFGNQDAGDGNPSFYWNGSNLGSSNSVGFIFTSDGGGTAAVSSGLVVRTSTNTNLFDSTPDQTLNYGTYRVKVVDENRFQLASSSNQVYRLVQATGDYQFNGQKRNETANTFWASSHGYNGEEEVVISAVNGGTLPTVNSGPIMPVANISSGTTDEAWAIFDNWLTDYATNSASVRDIVLSPSTGSSNITQNGSPAGTGAWLQYLSNNGGNVYSQQLGQSAGLISSANNYWSSAEVKNYANAPLNNSSYGVIGTDFSPNAAKTHYSWLMYGNGDNTLHEFTQYLYVQSNTGYTTYQNSNVSLTVNGDSNWRWTGHGVYINGSGSNQGNFVYQLRVWNNGWFGSQQFHYQYNYGNFNSGQFMYIYGTGAGYFTLNGIMGLTTTSTFTTTTVQSFLTDLATHFATNFAYPDLTQGSSTKVAVVNSNRFSIANTAGFAYDLTSSGTPTLTFTQTGVLGALDGAYTVTSTPTENSFIFDLPFSAPATTITFDANLIANNLIAFNSPHNFDTGSPVTYDSNGNADVTGIVNTTVYYVYVQDDLYIGLANSYENALTGTINTISPSAAQQFHNLSFTTVNGKIQGRGGVSTTAFSKLITGDDETLFKRYFKVGDTISIKDPTATPGVIRQYLVSAISDDQTLEVTDSVTFTSSNTAYYLGTKLYARPDGYSVHRPFDGGIEIAAGTAPFSQIRRQTRKYFRYQSGKGIQTSLAINFNPPTQFETIFSAVDTNKTLKCERDIGYLLDGVGYDIALGTNYNSIFLGIAETNSLDISQTVLNTIISAKTRVLELPQVLDSSLATNRATTFFDEVLNVAENGREVASSYSFTNPTNATTSVIAAKDKMIANLAFIEAEINAYVAVNYPNYDHDVNKCTRDIKYAIYSFCYDILYGGNSATYDNARFFYYFDSTYNPGIDPTHKAQTVDAYRHLAAIVPQIVQGIAITPSAGNTEPQVLSGNNASSSDANIIATLSSIIENVVRYGKAFIDGTGTAELLSVVNDGASNYVINGFADPVLTVVRGVTYTFDIDAVGHPFWIKTAATTGTGNQYNTGVTNNGTDNGIITWTVDASTPSTLYYNCEIHASMGGTISVIDPIVKSYPSVTWPITELIDARANIISNKATIISLSVPDIYAATGKTRYPHRLTLGQSILVTGASDPAFNGIYAVNELLDEFRFKFSLESAPSSSIPNGIVQYNLNGYRGAYTRAGMFDLQNGFFFEYNGTELYCVRRSSTQQLSGVVEVSYNSNLVRGTDTNFLGQLQQGDKIVIRGGTYKIVKIKSRTELVIQPQYKGISAPNVILTKTVDVKVPQSQWNIDTSDGYGPSGFNLNINKIQMAYMDYSWYGAGKVRFGFKDRKGRVRYVHEFLHNNRLDEAYMRSGNIPAAYEIENDASPSYAPTLFHWGTSVIMDGRFDEDDAYLFTAPSKTLTFTNGQANTATTNQNSSLFFVYNRSLRTYDWWVRLFFPTSDAPKFSSGTSLYTVSGSLNGEEVDYTQYSGNSIAVYIYVARSISTPSVYPIVPSGTVVSIGAPPITGSPVALGTATIPLVTLRLAPSVDSSLSGDLGAREIINRMQLKLAEVGLILTHDCEVSLILNGDLSSISWENVKSPSLSQLIKHNAGDKILGGTEVFTFRASGGSVDNLGKRLSNTSNFSLGSLIDMGNSVLGGNGVFPNGPDILTVAVRLVNTSDVNANSPFTASARITWSESQA
jgi:hypothetical protein